VFNANVPHFGIVFQGDGGIQAFDGNQDVTGTYRNWGGTGNDATLHSFTIIAVDPTDGNPFDGRGQTNIYAYADQTLIYKYVKTGGGYTNNYINFASNGISALDNLKIENFGLVTFQENTTGLVYRVRPNTPELNPADAAFNFSLSGTDSNLFNINSRGEITFKAPPSYSNPLDQGGDNIYDLIVNVSEGSFSISKSVVVLVKNENDRPTDLSLSSLSVNENVIANTTVGTFSTVDPDPGNPFIYTLVSGTGSTDNAAFTIRDNQLQIKATPNFATKSSYNIRVRSTDEGNLFVEKALTITVNQVNETPTNIALSTSTINETVAPNTLVGTFITTDPDTGNTFTYRFVDGLGAIDNGAFTIEGNQLKINNSPILSSKSSYSIRVQTTDQDGLSLDKILAIGVNQTPVDLALSATTVNENVPVNSTVGFLTSSDPKFGDVFTYSLVAGAGDGDNGAFTIDGDLLKISNSPDFESKSTYNLRLRTTDQGGLFFEKAIAININNVNEAPIATGEIVSTIKNTGDSSITIELADNITDPDDVGINSPVSMMTAPIAKVIASSESDFTLMAATSNSLVSGLNGAVLNIIEATNGQITRIDQNARLITFTPTPGFSGTAAFKYTITDAGGLTSNEATFTVEVGDIIITGNQSQNIQGTAGDDYISTGNGKDAIRGKDGNDTLLGNNGADQLYGDAGNDLLNGGNGPDQLTGGAGRDKFVLTRSAGGDTITDFTDGVDWLALSGNLTLGQLRITVSGNNTLIKFGNETLATLTGVNSNLINAADLITI
jgi:hypothetical protein